MTATATKSIAALLTPASPGAIAVIALSGGRTCEIMNAVARRPSADAAPDWKDRRPVLCRIFDGSEQIDDAIVTLIQHGGEALAEIHLHGGVRITQRVMMLLECLGATVVSPAEFPDVLRPNDAIVRRIDAAIEKAGSRRLARWLLAQRELLPAYFRIRNNISHSDRDAFVRRSNIAARLIDGINIAIVGPPNAGKSTLANRLIGTDRVITSDIPGTTRDWISETALIDGWPVTLIDTAGIRETSCDIEAEAVRRGRERARFADITLLVTDATEPADLQENTMRSILRSMPADAPFVLVKNKCDRPVEVSPTEGRDICEISALTGRGISELEHRICRTLGLDLLDESLPAAFFRWDEGVAA